MKIIVTGGRDYNDYQKIQSVLNHFKPTLIIHGDCSGADYESSVYAEQYNIEQKKYSYPSHLGRAGGPIRNKQMCEENQDALLVAFPGGRGTASCIREAKKLGMKVFEVIE